MIGYFDYIDNGFRIFGLHGVDENGFCECGNPNCKALYKHPSISNWQNVPRWSGEQLSNMVERGQLKTGFGVLVDDHIIIDVDPRNGGDKAYIQLCKDLDIDFVDVSGFTVKTGGGGLHIYFKRPKDFALVSHLDKYQGIDFKSSGYVVGCGSMHASGNMYEIEKGVPMMIDDAPDKLLKLLKKPDKRRTEYKGQHVDLSDADLNDLLEYCDYNCDYDTWIKIGMALHEASNGTAIDLWDCWSSNSDKYPKFEQIERHWHSFGKAANPVGVGTLFYYAEQGGYKPSVTFESDLQFSEIPQDSGDIDLLRPCGFVGQVTDWINSQCRYPREHLAVATALSTIGNIAGLRYEDQEFGVTSNQFIFCVAGSATGKEAVQQAQNELHAAAGFAPAVHGAIKSEQEVIRNLVNHQAAIYTIDELGIVLQKINNARKRGGAAYLEGVIGTFMSAYSKANSVMLLSGDVREEVKAELGRKAAALNRKIDEGDEHAETKLKKLTQQMIDMDQGIQRPFLSLIGYTTPVTFNELVDYEQSANGFIGRSLVIQEKETNPKIKKGFKKPDLPMPIKMALCNIAWNGHTLEAGDRIQQIGDRKPIPTEQAAIEYLEKVSDHFHEMAEESKESSLEAIPRRAFELVLKVSLVLAIPEGVRTLEHVRWAEAYVKRDIEQKINLAASNMADEDKRHDEALARKILGMLDKETPATSGVIRGRFRKYKKEDVDKLLEILAANGKIKKIEGSGKKKSFSWLLL